MGVEPERKFLVVDDSWKKNVTKKTRITQRYLQDKTDVQILNDGRGQNTLYIGSVFSCGIGAQDARELKGILTQKPTLRVRTTDKGEAFLTIKGKAPKGTIDTPEFEYAVPLVDASAMMTQYAMPGEITKTRHYVPYHGKTWEVDVFDGANAGLIVAEIELTHGKEKFDKPAWAGQEVTDDKRYKNAALLGNPYQNWASPPKKPKAGKGPRH